MMQSRRDYLDRFRPKRERILALLASGLGRTEVAKKLGISRQRVHQVVRESLSKGEANATE